MHAQTAPLFILSSERVSGNAVRTHVQALVGPQPLLVEGKLSTHALQRYGTDVRPQATGVVALLDYGSHVHRPGVGGPRWLSERCLRSAGESGGVDHVRGGGLARRRSVISVCRQVYWLVGCLTSQ